MLKTAITTTLVLLAPAAWGQSGRPAGVIVIKPGPSADESLLATPFGPSNWEWSVGKPPSLLPLAATHICLLAKVSGNFAGAGERIALYVDGGSTGGPRWVLHGTSGQAQLMANATCVPKARFATGGVPVAGKIYGNHMTGSCAPHEVAMPDSSTTHGFFVSGMAGKWRGNGESVTAKQGLFKGMITVTGCSGYADGTLMAVSVGAKPLKYRTLAGFTTAAKAATTAMGMVRERESGEFFLNDETSYLAPMDEAVCGITSISGKFQGYGEQVSIVPEKNTDGKMWWKANMSSQAEQTAVGLKVRCIARDQR